MFMPQTMGRSQGQQLSSKTASRIGSPNQAEAYARAKEMVAGLTLDQLKVTRGDTVAVAAAKLLAQKALTGETVRNPTALAELTGETSPPFEYEPVELRLAQLLRVNSAVSP